MTIFRMLIFIAGENASLSPYRPHSQEAVFEIVVKTNTMILDAERNAPRGGLAVTVRGDYGRVVVKISLEGRDQENRALSGKM